MLTCTVNMRRFPCIIFFCWMVKFDESDLHIQQLAPVKRSNPPKKGRETPFFQPQCFRCYLSFREKMGEIWLLFSHFDFFLRATSFRCSSFGAFVSQEKIPEKIEVWKISFLFNCTIFGFDVNFQGCTNILHLASSMIGEGWSHERWHHCGWRHTKQWQKRWNVGHLRGKAVSSCAVDVQGLSRWGKKEKLPHRCMRFYGYTINWKGRWRETSHFGGYHHCTDMSRVRLNSNLEFNWIGFWRSMLLPIWMTKKLVFVATIN